MTKNKTVLTYLAAALLAIVSLLGLSHWANLGAPCPPERVRERLESQYAIVSAIKDDRYAFYVSREPIAREPLGMARQSERIARWRGIVVAQLFRERTEVQTEQWDSEDYDRFAGFVWFGDRELMAEIRAALGY